MHRSKIEWVLNPDNKTLGWVWNPLTGCLNHVNGMCKGGNFPCYAYRLATTRLRDRYLANNITAPQGFANRVLPRYDPFYPRFWPERLADPYAGKSALGKPKGVFVCDMSDLFGIGIPEDWTRQVLHYCKMSSQHRFYLLTKQPQNLVKFSPFPDNCWLGVSATNQQQFDNAVKYLKEVEATVKYISFEPLLERIDIGASIGYNTEYESEIQGSHSLQDGRGGGIRDRRPREDMEDKSSEVGQVERGQQDTNLRETQGGKRHRQISASEDDDKRETLSRIGSQVSVVSLQRDDTTRINNQPQRRECKGQSARKHGTNDLQPEHQALHKDIGQDIQEGQSWPFSWVIIGSQTKPYKPPEISWVGEIVEAADKAGIPVFLKNNLKRGLITSIGSTPSWATNYVSRDTGFVELRQELPK